MLNSATHLQITVLVDQNVGWLEITVDDTSRVDILKTTEDLVKEVLDELLLQRARSQETVKVGTKELGDKVASVSAEDNDAVKETHMSSRGEMKMSLREMIYC